MVSSQKKGKSNNAPKSVENLVSYEPKLMLSGRSSRSRMVVVAKTHVRNHGIASGETTRDNNDLRRGPPITRGRAASSISLENRGSSANRTLSAFSGSLGLVDDFKGDRKGIMMAVGFFFRLVFDLVVPFRFLCSG